MAMDSYLNRGPLKVSPYLLPNLCANLPGGQGRDAAGLHRPDLLPAGGLRLRQPRHRHRGAHDPRRGLRLRAGRGRGHLPGPRDRAGLRQHERHHQHHARRTARSATPPRPRGPFSIDRKGMSCPRAPACWSSRPRRRSRRYGLEPKAEVLGIGWTSDAHHFTAPNPQTIVRAIREAIDDAGLAPGDIGHVNAHGTSTPKGDKVEVDCLRDGVRAEAARHSRLLEQVPDRPHPGRRGGHRGGARRSRPCARG